MITRQQISVKYPLISVMCQLGEGVCGGSLFIISFLHVVKRCLWVGFVCLLLSTSIYCLLWLGLVVVGQDHDSLCKIRRCM